jgi:hypothetical protein
MTDPFLSTSEIDNASFATVLKNPQNILLVFSVECSRIHRNLSIVRLNSWKIGDGGRKVEVLATKAILLDEQESAKAYYRGLGLDVGDWDPETKIAWHFKENSLQIWNDDGQLAVVASGGKFTNDLGVGEQTEFKAIRAFCSESLILHFLSLEKIAGGRMILLLRSSINANLNPSYGRQELESETSWAHALGTLISQWIKVPFINDI